jgi:glycosyltransferase involved in cell wall biosynthesis
VCSAALQDRWQQRYTVEAKLVPNGVDLDAYRVARRRLLPGHGPHYCYVGTLHEERLDVELVIDLAKATTGTVVLVGPDHLAPSSRARLADLPNIEVTGPVPSADVPSVMCSADVLLLPHVVTPFSLSLDAIKAYEYLATTKQVVATPTSGFQSIAAPGVRVVRREQFVAAALSAARDQPVSRAAPPDWDARARLFAQVGLGL